MTASAIQTMDVTSLKAVVTDLRQIILPSRFEKAQQPEPGTIQIGLRTLQGLTWIELSWHAEAPRLVQISTPSPIGSESTLAKQIQHGLHQMALVKIKQSGFERVVKFGLAPRPGLPVQRILVIEIMGRHSNFLLLDDQNKIITLGRQVSNHQSRIRPLGTGDIYVEPPTLQGQVPTSNESFEKWKERLCLIPYNLKKALQDSYQGISPSLALQLADDEPGIANKFLELPVLKLSDRQWQRLYTRWCYWLQAVEDENLKLSFKGPTSFRLWNGENNKESSKKNTSLILGKYYRDCLNNKRFNELTKKLEQKLEKLIGNEKRNLLEQQNLLDRIPNNKLLQRKADNLLCSPSPNRDSIDKAQNLYLEAKKLRRSLPAIEERVSHHKERIKSLKESSSFLEELRTNQWEKFSDKLKRLIELKQELNEFQATLSIRNRNRKRKRNDFTSLKNKNPQPLVLKSTSGLEIQVGRNHRQNEWISLQNSRSGDIWFHVQECPGSHVVLKASNGLAEEKDIQMAADLAAFFSRAKGNKRVPVVMASTDNLKRIPGATPGAIRHRQGIVCWGEPSKGIEHIKG